MGKNNLVIESLKLLANQVSWCPFSRPEFERRFTCRCWGTVQLWQQSNHEMYLWHMSHGLTSKIYLNKTTLTFSWEGKILWKQCSAESLQLVSLFLVPFAWRGSRCRPFFVPAAESPWFPPTGTQTWRSEEPGSPAPRISPPGSSRDVRSPVPFCTWTWAHLKWWEQTHEPTQLILPRPCKLTRALHWSWVKRLGFDSTDFGVPYTKLQSAQLLLWAESSILRVALRIWVFFRRRYGPLWILGLWVRNRLRNGVGSLRIRSRSILASSPEKRCMVVNLHAHASMKQRGNDQVLVCLIPERHFLWTTQWYLSFPVWSPAAAEAPGPARSRSAQSARPPPASPCCLPTESQFLWQIPFLMEDLQLHCVFHRPIFFFKPKTSSHSDCLPTLFHTYCKPQTISGRLLLCSGCCKRT